MSAANTSMVFPMLAGCATILVPCILGVQHAARKRAYEHTERMRALELGIAPPGDSAWPAAVCVAIGALVPICALTFAMIVTLVTQRSGPVVAVAAGSWSSHHAEEFHGILWGCTTAVCLFGVTGGVLLAFRLLGSHKRATGPQIADGFANDGALKPSFDPDAYDTVSRRG